MKGWKSQNEILKCEVFLRNSGSLNNISAPAAARWTPTPAQRRCAEPQTSGDPTRARPADGSSPALKAFGANKTPSAPGVLLTRLEIIINKPLCEPGGSAERVFCDHWHMDQGSEAMLRPPYPVLQMRQTTRPPDNAVWLWQGTRHKSGWRSTDGGRHLNFAHAAITVFSISGFFW